MRIPWTRKKEYDIDCERYIKYNGTKIDLSSLGIDKLSLGKISIEPTLLQAASQALMLLDFSQYQLCKAIKNAPNEEERKKSYNRMMDDIARLQGIYNAIAALSVYPSSPVLQNSLKELLLSNIMTNSNRAIEVEKDYKIGYDDNIIDNNSIDIGHESLNERIEYLKSNYPEIKPKFPTESQVSNHKNIIIMDLYGELLNQFDEANEKGTILEFYKTKLRPAILKITRDYNEIIGEDNATEISNRLLKLNNEIIEFKKIAGSQTKEEADALMLINIRMRNILDKIQHSYLLK